MDTDLLNRKSTHFVLWAPAPYHELFSSLSDATVDAAGAPHALIMHFESEYERTTTLFSELFVLDGTAPKAQAAKGSRP